MAIQVFVLGAILIACGLGSLAAAINLVPTEMGLLYAVSGVIFLSASAVVLAIAALIVRIGRLAPRAEKAAAELGIAGGGSPPLTEPATASAEPGAPSRAEEDEVNLNRAGRLPSLRAVEEAVAHPQAPPRVIGRYSVGGANYLIYSDGAIEAETDEGAFRFASMGDLKSYIASRQS